MASPRFPQIVVTQLAKDVYANEVEERKQNEMDYLTRVGCRL